MTPTIQFRRPGWRSLAWAVAIVALGSAIGLGLNQISSVGINMTIALGLDQPATPAQPGGQP